MANISKRSTGECPKLPSKDIAAYLFHGGINYKAYNYLGLHRNAGGYTFRVWAPGADEVRLVGDFNGWSDGLPLTRITDGGIWEIFVEDDSISLGDKYKYKIRRGERFIYKADPFCRHTPAPPETASLISDEKEYVWRDDGWLAFRKKMAPSYYSLPMNVYELHLGSWKRREDGSMLGYDELARELAPYVKQMGYTHVEIMPIAEYPNDASWGYQTCSYFSPTARYGTAEQLKSFVDSMHEAGIGVILDWVPAHFPKDDHGLCEFDGAPLYEYAQSDRQEHPVWKTRMFDLGRNEVISFLVSSADYWIRSFHIDALRVDAVSTMIRLDHEKEAGAWTPNKFGDSRCLEGREFLRRLNSYLKREFPDVLLIAEESGADRGITGFEKGGLGFDMKWNLGWMNDTLSYAVLEPSERAYNHTKLNFPLTYAFDEKHMLPVSHDEVVHGKRSFLDKMSGDYWQKFAGARAFMGYMMTHPGKKLSFMGNEIGQFREWDFDGEIEWFLLEYETHARFQRYVAELNHFYLSQPALWQIDGSWRGFEWIEPDDSAQSILSYRRIAKDGSELLVLINFTPTVYNGFLLGTDRSGVYREVFNSDETRFGGGGVVNKKKLKTTGKPISRCKNSIEIKVPPLAVAVFKAE